MGWWVPLVCDRVVKWGSDSGPREESGGEVSERRDGGGYGVNEVEGVRATEGLSEAGPPD